MLILSRKVGEKIMIGPDVTIMVVEARDGKARIGIEAPRAIPVHRREVFDAIEADKRPKPAEAACDESIPDIDLITCPNPTCGHVELCGGRGLVDAVRELNNRTADIGDAIHLINQSSAKVATLIAEAKGGPDAD